MLHLSNPRFSPAELEKFRPFQQRILTNIQQQHAILQEVYTLWKKLKEHAGGGAGSSKYLGREGEHEEEGFGDAVCRGEGHVYGSDG